jgi:hydroxypyruvate reductase
VDGETEARCKARGIDPRLALWENDAYRALEASGDLLFLGQTGTNVADLVVLGVEKC